MGFIELPPLMMQVFQGPVLENLIRLHDLPWVHQPGHTVLCHWRGTDGPSQGLPRACVSMECCPGMEVLHSHGWAQNPTFLPGTVP